MTQILDLQSANVFSASKRDLFCLIFGLTNIIRVSVLKFTHLFMLEVHLFTQYAYELFCKIFYYIFTCYLPRERKTTYDHLYGTSVRIPQNTA